MKFILYCRKSTDTDDKQVLSLDLQEHELLELAQRDGLEIVETLRESMSAKAPGRPVFADMMQKIALGKADGILCWKIDRLTRNPVDGGQLQWLLQNGKINCIRTSEKSYYPNDNVLLMSIEQAMASQYIRDLSSNVKRGNRAKLEKGDWPNHAPFGYLNDKATKTIIVDIIHAPYVVRMFELYATGGHTLDQITTILYKEGLRTRTGNKLYKNHIHRVIKDSFYFGLMQRDGKLYQGNHTPLITKKLYDDVQDVLNGKLHPKPKTHFYSARGFLTCEKCGCMLTAETQKGHKYYHCTNGKGGCDEKKKYLKNDEVDIMLANMFKVLQIDEEFIELSGKAYKAKYQTTQTYTQTTLDTLHGELYTLTEKESSLVDGYLSKLISEPIYAQKKLDIENKRVIVTKQIADIESKSNRTVTFEQIKSVFTDGNKASYEYLSSDEYKKRILLEKILSNASIKNGNVAQYQFKSPYSILAKVQKKDDFLVLCPGEDSNLHAREGYTTSRCNVYQFQHLGRRQLTEYSIYL